MRDILDINIKGEIISTIKKYKFLKKYKIKEVLGINKYNKSICNLFEKEFKALCKENIIVRNKNKKYMLNIPKDYFVSKIHFNNRGSAFAVSNVDNQNYFINKKDVLNSLNEDIVLAVKIKDSTPDSKLPEAKVLTVLERETKTIIGTYIENNENFGFVIPDNNKFNRDIYVSSKNKSTANSYDKVVVKITKYPTYKVHKSNNVEVFNPEGEIIEVLGMKGEKGVDSLSVIKENNIREEFPTEVKREANNIKILISSDEKDKRLDLTNELIYTIDGADARDLDDSISVKKIDNYYELGVHIADVSHYVKENGAIDKEAILRGTSVYLTDRVIPMLPKILSNNVCSLNPNEEKLTLSCIMRINKNGEVIDCSIKESFVSSRARLVYDDVSDWLENRSTTLKEEYPEIADNLLVAKELAEILIKKRERRGSIEFDSPESKIILDENGKVINVEALERGIANDIIEEFMLITNESIAKTFCDLKIPFVYRAHSYPRTEKLETFERVLRLYGYNLDVSSLEDIEPKVLQTFLEEHKDSENIEPLKLLLLQSMQQARYHNKCDGHFGLASKYYCHFTSPIRRYPDLQIHRIIKEYLKGNLNNKVIKQKYEKITEEICEHCSKTERIAEKAESELNKMKINEYILDNFNCEYEGFIRNFNKGGMFVSLNNTAEGYIKPKNFTFDEDNYQGIYDDKILKLGTKVKVKPKRNNNDEIIYEIIEILE